MIETIVVQQQGATASNNGKNCNLYDEIDDMSLN